jgi:hypothetical protein
MAVYNVDDLKKQYGTNYQAGINAANKAGNSQLAGILTGLRAEKLQTMDTDQLNSALVNKAPVAPTVPTAPVGGALTGQPTPPTVPTNKFENNQVDLMSKMSNYGNTNINPYNSKYNAELAQQLSMLSNQINNPTQYSPDSDVGLQSAQRQAMDATSRAAARRNMLYSDANKYQMGQAALNLVPQFQQQFENQQQNKLGNLFNLMGVLQQMEGQDYGRYRDTVQDTRYADEMGYNRMQDQFQNYGQLNQQDIQKQQLGLQQRETDASLTGYDPITGKRTLQAQQYDTQNSGTWFNPETGKTEKTLEAQKFDAEKMYKMADLTGYLNTPEIQQAATGEIPQQFIEKMNRYSQSAGGMQGYINSLNPGSAEYVYANRLRNEKILSDPKMFKQYGNTIKTEFGFRTVDGQQLDFNKAMDDWTKQFEIEKWDYTKAKDLIEQNYKRERDKTDDQFRNREISLSEKTQRDNNAIAIKNYELESSKFSWSKYVDKEQLKISKSKASGSSSSSSGKMTEDEIIGNVYSQLKGLSVKDAKATLNDTAKKSEYIKTLGEPGYNKLWNLVLGDAIDMGQAQPKGLSAQDTIDLEASRINLNEDKKGIAAAKAIAEAAKKKKKGGG